jgi:hypothetical protein
VARSAGEEIAGVGLSVEIDDYEYFNESWYCQLTFTEEDLRTAAERSDGLEVTRPCQQMSLTFRVNAREQ